MNVCMNFQLSFQRERELLLTSMILSLFLHRLRMDEDSLSPVNLAFQKAFPMMNTEVLRFPESPFSQHCFPSMTED